MEKKDLKWLIGLFFDIIEFFVFRTAEHIHRLELSRQKWLAERNVRRFISEARIKQIMGEYANMRLYDLDSSYFLVNSQKKLLESRRTVHVSIWKAGPLAIVPLITASVTLLKLINLGDDAAAQQTLNTMGYILFGLGIFVFVLALVGWVISKRIDKELAEDEIRLKEIERHISNKVAGVRSKFLSYGEDMDRQNKWLDGYGGVEFDDKLSQRKAWRISSRFDSKSLADMRHRYRFLVTEIELLETCEDEYINRLVLFSIRAKTLLEDADKAAGITQQQESEKIMASNIKALFIMFLDKVEEGQDLDKFGGENGFCRSQIDFLHQLWSKDENNPYSQVAVDKQLKDLASEAVDYHEKGIELYRNLKPAIDYLFEDGKSRESYAIGASSILGVN